MAASYISVPRDLTKVKSKVMFNLTKRQIVCFFVAALIGVELSLYRRPAGVPDSFIIFYIKVDPV